MRDYEVEIGAEVDDADAIAWPREGMCVGNDAQQHRRQWPRAFWRGR
jgi:hypothetical protein